MRTIVTLIGFVVLAACRTHPGITLDHSQLMLIAGTFSDMHTDSQTHLTAGTTMRVFVAGEGYETILQFGEGMTQSRLVYANTEMGIDWPLGVPIPNAELDRERLTLTFDQHGYSGTFEGFIYPGLVEGEFRFSSGETQRVKLPLIKCK